VFAANELSAVACMRALAETWQLAVPHDYSLVSVDDSDYLPYCLPLLTSFRLPLQTIGSLAAGMLLNQIDGSLIAEKKLTLKAELKVRDSVRSLDANERMQD
jgi:LacI family transcriptional regulator